ncbi:MAG: hypothetical protein ACLFU0_05685 [Alphaproteobacteria bacterium]
MNSSGGITSPSRAGMKVKPMGVPKSTIERARALASTSPIAVS